MPADGYAPPASTGSDKSAAETIEEVADAADQLTELGLPIGWSDQQRDGVWWLLHILGWILTAALISVGAPFWFDLLSRLTAVRSPRPALAAEDPTSATRIAAEPPAGGA